jgi:hypothetical protein
MADEELLDEPDLDAEQGMGLHYLLSDCTVIYKGKRIAL